MKKQTKIHHNTIQKIRIKNSDIKADQEDAPDDLPAVDDPIQIKTQCC